MWTLSEFFTYSNFADNHSLLFHFMVKLISKRKKIIKDQNFNFKICINFVGSLTKNIDKIKNSFDSSHCEMF